MGAGSAARIDEAPRRADEDEANPRDQTSGQHEEAAHQHRRTPPPRPPALVETDDLARFVQLQLELVGVLGPLQSFDQRPLRGVQRVPQGLYTLPQRIAVVPICHPLHA